MANAPSILPSFGRRRGRKLRPSRSALYASLLPRLLVLLPPGDEALKLAGIFADASRPLWFEIGFGGGEHLAEQAGANRQVNFIGCEPYMNGMAGLLARVEKEGLDNVRLYDGDAREVLEHLPDGCIERMFVLFPDPWPKARHHKKRIISPLSLALFRRKLKIGGLLRIATDHEDYGVWILERVLASRDFAWEAQKSRDWAAPPEGWVRTRYQQKAESEGRPAMFLDLIAMGAQEID